MLSERVSRVREQIAEAAVRSGRTPDAVKLVAVTKTVDAPTAQEVFQLGVQTLGENRVQSLLDKYKVMGNKPEWHLIGHLQTNKVKYIIDKVELIHSVDSVHLAEEINRRAENAKRVMPVLLQVNVAREETKFGFRVEELEEALEKIAAFSYIRVDGLMTIAPKQTKPDENRKYFYELMQLFVDIRSKKYDNIHMKELSMGMSGDFESAILEGATMVRVGSALFQPL